jgi:hypothetical protein
MLPAYREYNKLLSSDDVEELYKLTEYDPKTSLEQAQIYLTDEKKNVVDEDTRKCSEMMLDPSMMKWLDEKITAKLNDDVEHMNVRFEIHTAASRIVRYEEGGFFRRHSDVIDVASNMFANYACLVCLEPCEEGGETKLYTTFEDEEDDITPVMGFISQKTSKVRGGGLIFPKHREHEGLEIKKGSKTILFVNYLCYPMQQKFMLLTVEAERFIIPIDLLTGLLHEIYLALESEHPNETVFQHMTDMMTADKFRVVYKDMFMQSDYDYSDYVEMKTTIDYLCYQMTDCDHITIDKYKIVSGNETAIMNSLTLPRKNSAIQSFEIKIITVVDKIFVDYLIIGDMLVFSEPCKKYEIEDGGYGLIPSSGIAVSIREVFDYSECINDCHTYFTFFTQDSDGGMCLNCAERIWQTRKASDDAEKPFVEYFEQARKDNRGMELTGDRTFKEFEDDIKEYKDDPEMIEYVTPDKVGPEIMRDTVVKASCSKQTLGGIAYLNDTSSGVDLNTVNIIKIIYSMINDDNVTSVEKGRVASWCGKKNKEIIHEMVIRKGYIDLGKYVYDNGE